MTWLRPWFQKILSILRVRSMVAGLDVSDEMVRLAYFDGKLWQMHAIRLSPGTMENGKMKDRGAFLSAMAELRLQSKVIGYDKTKKVAVVVALSSASAYSKVFRLPVIKGDNLEKAIALNLEMASPSDAAKVYASSQIVGHDVNTNQLDVLAAFMDRSMVDDLVEALFEAGFIAIAVEPRSLALMRVFREKGSGIDISKSYVMVSIDNAGLEFFIVRNGVPYFEYVNHWRDIANEKGELSLEALTGDLKVSLRQVLNFYAQHWTEPIAAIILSNATYPDEVENTIAANFAFPAVRLSLLMGQAISPEWLTALGSSLRETGLRVSKDKEISFLGVELEDRFRVDQMVRFLEFWRAIFPATLAVLVAAFFILNLYLDGAKAAIEAGPGFKLAPNQSADLAQLEASTTFFNNSVNSINRIENSAVTQAAVLGDIGGMAATNAIVISHLSVQGGPVTLSATSNSEDHISSFKAALTANPKISNVNLPLNGIQTNPGGTYAFTVTFTYNSGNNAAIAP